LLIVLGLVRISRKKFETGDEAVSLFEIWSVPNASQRESRRVGGRWRDERVRNGQGEHI